LTPIQLYTAYSQGSSLFDEEIDHDGESNSDDDVNSYDVEDSDTIIVPQFWIPQVKLA